MNCYHPRMLGYKRANANYFTGNEKKKKTMKNGKKMTIFNLPLIRILVLFYMLLGADLICQDYCGL